MRRVTWCIPDEVTKCDAKSLATLRRDLGEVEFGLGLKNLLTLKDALTELRELNEKLMKIYRARNNIEPDRPKAKGKAKPKPKAR